MLTKFTGCDESRKLISQTMKDDLGVWKNAISTAQEGIPLGDIFGELPLTVVRYLSDAAEQLLNGQMGIAKISLRKGT